MSGGGAQTTGGAAGELDPEKILLTEKMGLTQRRCDAVLGHLEAMGLSAYARRAHLAAFARNFAKMSSRNKDGGGTTIDITKLRVAELRKLIVQDPKEWRPEVWAKADDRADDLAKHEEHIQRPTTFSKTIRCPKCKKFMATYREQQMRSGDEGATMIAQCWNWEEGCQHTWKQN